MYLLDSRNGRKVILVYEGVLPAQSGLHFLFLLAWERKRENISYLVSR